MIKRFLAVILILFAVVAISGCSKEDKRVRSLNVSSDDIALLTLFSDNGKEDSFFLARNYGHTFLSITNKSENAFVVGDMEVSPNSTITIGLWSVLEHFGVWYNLESNYIKEHNKYSERVSITIGITKEDISEINDIIKKNNTWTPWYNCSCFALDIWNNVATDSEKITKSMFVSPGYLVKEIKKFDAHEKGRICEANTPIRYYGEV